jgi:glutamate dehydrogenase (NAD(P)+)
LLLLTPFIYNYYMKQTNRMPAGKPALVVEYTDPIEGFKGWLVRDSIDHRICAGGMRVQEGLTCRKLADMARNMSCKMRIAGLRVDGAKSGIDYDPGSPAKAAAVARYLQAIRPYIEATYSMGPDLNMEMDELEKIAHGTGIASIKMAIARAQGWELDYFLERCALLQHQIDGFSLSRLRAGYGLAAAVLAVLDFLAIRNTSASVAIQGFGTLARAAASTLYKAGVRIVAIADIEKCFVATREKGLDIPKLLLSSGPLLDAAGSHDIIQKPSAAVTELHCDVLVPAAVENSIPPDIASSLHAKIVVPGANLAVPDESLDILQEKSVIVLPDYLAGCGGSLSMEGMFGPTDHPSAQSVLEHVNTKIFEIVSRVLEKSQREKISPTAAANKLCQEVGRPLNPDSRPYGNP